MGAGHGRSPVCPAPYWRASGTAAACGTWAASAPDGATPLQQRITLTEQELADKQGELEERTEELDAARAANREPARALNQSG